MASGYSNTPSVQKLGIREGFKIAIVDAPLDNPAALGRLPKCVGVLERLEGPLDLIHFFSRERRSLEVAVPRLKRALETDGLLGVSWPKRSSRIERDPDGNVVREIGLKQGLVDVKVCAVDETWSALKFGFRFHSAGHYLPGPSDG
jgi:hypothetical protein